MSIKTRHFPEAVLVWLLLRGLGLLPLDMASAVGGKVAEAFGRFTKAHRTALANLARVFPEKSSEERRKIAFAAWNNLGRVAGEFPFIHRPVMAKRLQIEGTEHLTAALASGKNILFFSGHFGNWELCARAAQECHLPLALIYRPANNPWVDGFIRRIRGHLFSEFHTKGRKGARALLKALQEGMHLAMLVDQKMNEGMAVPFMGTPAMTAPAIAELALKYDAVLMSCRIDRLKGAYFRATVAPLPFEKNESPYEILVRIHQRLESWIRESPGQWFWMHNRWPKPTSAHAL